jgi:hypothetical protein
MLLNDLPGVPQNHSHHLDRHPLFKSSTENDARTRLECAILQLILQVIGSTLKKMAEASGGRIHDDGVTRRPPILKIT